MQYINRIAFLLYQEKLDLGIEPKGYIWSLLSPVWKGPGSIPGRDALYSQFALTVLLSKKKKKGKKGRISFFKSTKAIDA